MKTASRPKLTLIRGGRYHEPKRQGKSLLDVLPSAPPASPRPETKFDRQRNAEQWEAMFASIDAEARER